MQTAIEKIKSIKLIKSVNRWHLERHQQQIKNLIYKEMIFFKNGALLKRRKQQWDFCI